MFAPLAAVAAALLAAFHLWLLGQQAWTGQLEYDATLRWLLALVLVAGLVALHRRGAPLLGRRATSLWVLAAVLHGPALGNDARPSSQLAVTSDVAIELTGAVIGLALAMTLARATRARRAVLDLVGVTAGRLPPDAVTLAACGEGFLPRPPPRG